MKNPILKLSTFLLLILFIGVGCKKDEPLETDPAKIILGKWEVIELGGETIENPSGYKEYLPDSVLREYEYKTGNYYYNIYWIDSLLHEGVPVTDEFMLKFEYNYCFTENNNKLHLIITNYYANVNDFFLKRIK